MAFMSDRLSLIGRGSYVKVASFGDDRVPSQDHNPSTHIYTNPTTPTDITRIDISPHSVKIPNVIHRPISNWLRVETY